jgi:hypothetical protein
MERLLLSLRIHVFIPRGNATTKQDDGLLEGDHEQIVRRRSRRAVRYGFRATAAKGAAVLLQGRQSHWAGRARQVLCSAVFVSGREPAEAFKNSGFFLFPDEHRAGVSYAVDRDKKLVRMTHGATTRTAKFYGDQGCIIHPQDHDGIYFTPVPVKTRLPDATTQPWPMGDAPSRAPLPTARPGRVADAVDLAPTRSADRRHGRSQG